MPACGQGEGLEELEAAMEWRGLKYWCGKGVRALRAYSEFGLGFRLVAG
jgi:hypothetical protein